MNDGLLEMGPRVARQMADVGASSGSERDPEGL